MVLQSEDGRGKAAGDRAPIGSQPRVLIVDDSALARDVLKAMLEPAGYEIASATSGPEALDLLRRQRIDLVLLDVMLPAMDGFEVCRRIRARPETRTIPVIMVTALTAREQRIAGLDAGADDFVCKPIDRGELAARIRSQLRVKALMGELDRRQRELDALQESREMLAYMIFHDLKGPISAAEGCLHLLKTSGKDRLTDRELRYLENGGLACHQAMDLVHDVLDAIKLEKKALPLRPDTFDLADLVIERTRIFEGHGARRDVKVACRIREDLRPFRVHADQGLIARILSNLLSNAIRHTPEGRGVEVTLARSEDGAEIIVSDEGEGIAPAELTRLFRRFDHAAPRKPGVRHDSGLGLYFCRLAAEAHGGRIWAQSEVGKGSRFHVLLPSGMRRPRHAGRTAEERERPSTTAEAAFGDPSGVSSSACSSTASDETAE